MNIYVCGFLFSPDGNHVALIRKNKPDWQRGKLNGIGGKLEIGETIFECMTREFSEEAGMWISHWELFLRLRYFETQTVIHFFRARLFNPEDARLLTSVTDEQVGWYFKPDWCQKDMIPNLKWIIPMALSQDKGEMEILGDPTKHNENHTLHLR